MIEKVASVAPGSARREIRALEERVAELEREVQENRRLNVRVAELMDIVQELLVPLAQRDEARVQAFLNTQSTALD